MRSLTRFLTSVVALTAVAAGASAQTITALKLGEYDNVANNYIWQYKVENTKNLSGIAGKDLSHFILEMCANASSSLVETSPYKPVYKEIKFDNGSLLTNVSAIYDISTESGNDRTITGLKFDDGFDDVNYKLIEFRLTQDFAVADKYVLFKAGTGNNDDTKVQGPGCDLRVRVPEPSTVGLLALGTVAFGVVARRRKA